MTMTKYSTNWNPAFNSERDQDWEEMMAQLPPLKEDARIKRDISEGARMVKLLESCEVADEGRVRNDLSQWARGCGWSHTPPDIMLRLWDRITHAEAALKEAYAEIERLKETFGMAFNLNCHQHRKDIHAYTCGNNSRHRPLVAWVDRWKCADCDYEQLYQSATARNPDVARSVS